MASDHSQYPEVGADTYVIYEHSLVCDGGRWMGDFDDSGCTDLSDFLYLMDHWNQTVDGYHASGAVKGRTDGIHLPGK